MKFDFNFHEDFQVFFFSLNGGQRDIVFIHTKFCKIFVICMRLHKKDPEIERSPELKKKKKSLKTRSLVDIPVTFLWPDDEFEYLQDNFNFMSRCH